MVDRFIAYCLKEQLVQSNVPTLLAVSGGKDSITMVHLFAAAKFPFEIAHCNFKLRGDESDKDSEFVRDLAKKYQVPFHDITFETATYAKSKGISIQMAARELRYGWFQELTEKHNIKFIATAHHKNDTAETMLLNLTKGTGIAGLHGIGHKVNNIVRPLMAFSREEIDRYVEERRLKFREDSSNREVKYARNKIRHQVIPLLEEINPSLIKTLNTSATLFSGIEEILLNAVSHERQKCMSKTGKGYKINLNAMQELNPVSIYLYYFISDFGFNFSDVQDILNGLNAQSGQQYFSKTHVLIKNRTYLEIEERLLNEEVSYSIATENDFRHLPISLNAEKSLAKDLHLLRSKDMAYFDLDRLTFPLTLRKWKHGDVFYPFGMSGKKKVSDYFVDQKFSLLDKQKVWLLTTKEDKIAWVVGSRTDDRFKVTQKTTTVLILKLDEIR